MKIGEYLALRKGDIVEFIDTGDKCVIMHFDEQDYPEYFGEPRQEPNSSENLCVIFFQGDLLNFRLIGHRREFCCLLPNAYNKKL